MTPYTLILIPTLGRTKRLPRVIDDFAEATPEPHLIVFIVEEHELVATELAVGERAHVLFNRRSGHYGAFNTALEWWARTSGWEWWFHGADDVCPRLGWLSTALAVATAEPCVVGTNDLLVEATATGETATHYLVDRRYAEERPAVPGVTMPHAYYEGYHHYAGETEFIDVAKARGVFVPSSAVVEHLHYRAGKSEHDGTYRWGEAHEAEDNELYESRKHECAALSS